jgi:hypothetical protein
VSEKIFKKIVKDFEAFFRGSKGRSNQRSLIIGPYKGQIKRQKPVQATSKPQTLPYGPIIKSSHFEPSNGLDSLARTYRHRVGRLNDWYETYGQGMYE